MRFRQTLIRIVFVALFVTLFVAAIGLVTQLSSVQQRLSSLAGQSAPLPQEAPTPTAQPVLDGPPLSIPATPDLNNLPVPVDATATPNQPPALPSCGGASTITGVVLLPDGAPATNAAVQREMGSPADCWAALTNERGEFILQTLAAGTWVLRAWPHIIGDLAMPLYQSPFVTITVDGVNAFSLPIPIQLTGAQLVGQLRLANGQPGIAIPVGIAQVTGNPDCSMNATLAPTGVGTTSDETGHFQLGGLPTLGLHCIRIWSPTTQKLLFSQFATLSTPHSQIDLGIITISALSKHVTGTIRDSNGQVVEGTMSAGRLGEGPNIGFLIQTDANGHYAFDVEPGVWEVYVFPNSASQDLADLPVNERMQVVTFTEDESTETRVVDFVLPRPPAAQPLASPPTQRVYTVFMPMVAR
ncbi:MAG: hypothetical protein DYG89_43660 [Caldilinea sp. CFX5]|nr:hypothetical protein [Caldilinea sp. CFX5]